MWLVAAFAMAWLVARAAHQSVTIDEADGYLGYVAPDWPSHWYPSNGNHILNSVIVRLLTWLFGLSHLTLRGAALLGAAVYIFAAYRLCKMIAGESRLALPLFACFVFNPFVMDHLVAARGYSLALAFLTLGFYILSRQLTAEPDSELYSACHLASVCVALSFNANFSFAYADGACIAVFLLWACWRRDWRIWLKVGGACVIPALVVTAFISGSVLWNWPKGQFVFGAHSVREAWSSVVTSSFYELNQALVNPLMEMLLQRSRRWLPILAIVILVAEAAFLSARKFQVKEKRIVLQGGYALAVLLLALSLHWLQFRVFKILLPMDRTALFVVPLSLVAFGSLTALSPKVLRGFAIALLCVTAVYFMGCLRLLYFKEWRYDADVRTAYATVRTLNREQGIRRFASDWKYSASLNFYRRYFHDETAIDEVQNFDSGHPFGPGQGAYVLDLPDAGAFVQEQKLKQVYRGSLSDLVVAAP